MQLSVIGWAGLVSAEVEMHRDDTEVKVLMTRVSTVIYAPLNHI